MMVVNKSNKRDKETFISFPSVTVPSKSLKRTNPDLIYFIFAPTLITTSHVTSQNFPCQLP